jgi:hypothetical protein
LAAAALLVAACSSAPLGPKGWQSDPALPNAWATGTGAAREEYSYASTEFDGTRQDLASRVTIDALVRDRGAKLQSSVPFAPCPGLAAVATFRRGGGTTLQIGFAVRDGHAIRVRYVRPAGSPVDPAVTEAMQSALCAM